ncbi:odorant receptor 13a-like isoform X2 [Cephus cinctus]|nr:odorant receptor 13a-like isoform X2 [Cephus cinctus]XP_024938770.1 odorant receptor 13a-like isoform X2 [Cephus cinctus]
MDTATECSLIASAFVLCFLRLMVYTYHQKDMRYVVETMRSDWADASYEEKQVLKEKCDFAFRLAKYFIATVAITIAFFMTVPMLETYILHSEEKILPFRGYFFLNHTLSPNYEMIYIFEIIAGSFGGSMIAGVTSFNLVVIMHGAARFSLLQKKLESLNRNDPDVNKLMVKCIKLHQDAIKFADALEDIINVVALGQFVTSTGLVCFAGFQLTSMLEDRGRLMKYSTFLNSAILELFIFSFSGNELIVESEAVGDAAYRSDWASSSFTQSLRILMMRATLPSRITAAKFYSMSLESFSAVLSTSFSYFTVLKAVSEE